MLIFQAIVQPDRAVHIQQLRVILGQIIGSAQQPLDGLLFAYKLPLKHQPPIHDPVFTT